MSRCGIGRIGTALAGAVIARSVLAQLCENPPGGSATWERVNHRGNQVSLLGGPAAVAAAASVAALAPGVPGRVRLAALVAGVGAGAVGAYDDLAGSTHARGFAGHLAALRRGQVTTGMVKVVGIGACGLAASALASRGGRMSVVDTVIGGAVVASSANVANLLDLRPGRAGKAVLLAGVPLTCASGAGAFIAAAAGGAVAGILADDLGERVMLGDTGANGLGALLGLAAVAGLRRRGRLAVLASLLALNAASEKVSFTDVIARNPVLRRLDSVGRSP